MLTVLFATYNGALTLPDVLEAYTRIQAPTDGWKLVVVDNGSTDMSKDIVSSYSSKLPLVLLQENRRSKNTALNSGLPEVEGDLVALTDDDAIPRMDWLIRLRAIANAQLDFMVFGGSIVAKWPADPPPWILQWIPLGPVFSLTNPAWPEGPVSPEHVFGPNMAVRAEVFRQGARFDTSIGPARGSYTMGSETEFTTRLVQGGGRCWHCKEAVVAHIIRPQQMTKDWVLSRAVRYGRGRYHLRSSRLNPEPKMLCGMPRYLAREIVAQWLRTWKVRAAGTEEEIFKAQWRLKFLIGQAIEARSEKHP